MYSIDMPSAAIERIHGRTCSFWILGCVSGEALSMLYR